MATANYYQLLALPLTASLPDIKRRYRQLSFKYHPDRGGSVEKMIQINEAYRVLSNGLLRREYDRRQTMQPVPPPPTYTDVVRSDPSTTPEFTKPVQRPQAPLPRSRQYQPTSSSKSWSRFWAWTSAIGVLAVGFLAYQLYMVLQPPADVTDISPPVVPSSSIPDSSTSLPPRSVARKMPSSRRQPVAKY